MAIAANKININYKTLDFYRGLSAYIVLIGHFWQVFFAPIYNNEFIHLLLGSLARYAVLVFFVLSGFLIALSIDKNISKHNGIFNTYQYFRSRFLRIYPPLIFSILLVIGIGCVISFFDLHGNRSYQLPSDIGTVARPSYSYTIVEIVYTLLQTQSFSKGGYLFVNGPLWSLTYEVGFYYLVGFLFAFIAAIRCRKIMSTFIWIVLLALMIVMPAITMHAIFYIYFVVWLFGVVFYLVIRKRSKKLIYYLAAVSVALLVFEWYRFGISSIGVYYGLCEILLQLPVSFFLAGVIILHAVIKRSKKSDKISVFFIKGSDYSYSLYICHFPLLLLGFSFFHSNSGRNTITYISLAIIWLFGVILFCYYIAKIIENRVLLSKVLNDFERFFITKRLMKSPNEQYLTKVPVDSPK